MTTAILAECSANGEENESSSTQSQSSSTENSIVTSETASTEASSSISESSASGNTESGGIDSSNSDFSSTENAGVDDDEATPNEESQSTSSETSKNQGNSKEEAIRKTEECIALPGGSEHHTGLAVDMVDMEWINAGNGLDPKYDTQKSQHWLVDTMDEYGFILRYPKGKEEVTGIQYESWPSAM